MLRRRLLASALATATAFAPLAAHAAPIHTTYLWHMHQPIYWPERSTWNGKMYETAYETIMLGHSQNDVFSIFNSDDRVHDYQDYPKTALSSVLDIPDAGAQLSFAGSLIQNVSSLASAGWNGGRYAGNWYQANRDAMGWTTSGGRRRLEPVVVSFFHPSNPLIDDLVLKRMIDTQTLIMQSTWSTSSTSTGFFPAETAFSERMIPALVSKGLTYAIVPDVHIARACADYPYAANQDNCDPPNPADQINPAQGAANYYTQSISRGVTCKVPAPYGFRPHKAQYVDPTTGAVSSIAVVPLADAMSWNEGYGTYGTAEIDAIAAKNDPAKPMLVLFGHDGDNSWAGGYSYYTQNVSGFAHAAQAKGYEPTTIAEYLADHPVDPADIVHVEDGAWVNADGDFGSPQYINWNWPLTNSSGQFDIAGGWQLDERNWAVLTAATNRVETAEQISGATPSTARIVDPTQAGTTQVERAWSYLMSGFDSGNMYYGASNDFEIKATLSSNRAVALADSVIGGAAGDLTPPTMWLPQRLPWNPGGKGGGSLWGYPGGSGATMTQDFWVWTFAHDVSGVDTVKFVYRIDTDGVNPLASTQNETFAGGSEVGAWQTLGMTRRAFPAGNIYNDPSIVFSVMPQYIADEYYVHLSGFSNQLLDYYTEARDAKGNVSRSPIQHVWVGNGGSGGGGGGGTTPTWEPTAPTAGGTLTIHYDPVPGALADNTNPLYIHIGHSGWTQVVTPDPAMTKDATGTGFTYVYAIPATATSVDFVFTNGTGTWDNNGGADWHVSVTGGIVPSHVIDGVLDAGLTPVATCGAQSLYADYDGHYLYVAAPGVSTTSGADHFVAVAKPSTAQTQTAAWWAKAGTVTTYDNLLGNEDSNNWNGWFNAAGTVVTSGFSQASGSVLEGQIDVTTAWGTAPDSIRVAFAQYGSADGSALQATLPCGNGNGNLEATEWTWVRNRSIVAAPEPRETPRPGLARIALDGPHPAHGLLRLRVDAPRGPRLTVDVLDTQGRLVVRVFDGMSRGTHLLAATRRDGGALPAGVYVVRATTPQGVTTQRIVTLP